MMADSLWVLLVETLRRGRLEKQVSSRSSRQTMVEDGGKKMRLDALEFLVCATSQVWKGW